LGTGNAPHSNYEQRPALADIAQQVASAQGDSERKKEMSKSLNVIKPPPVSGKTPNATTQKMPVRPVPPAPKKTPVVTPFERAPKN
jgi:hypothetical protein